MQELNEKAEKPKILGPKPNIAIKPKHVPPVNLVKGQKVNRDDVNKTNLSRQTNSNNDFRHQQKEMSKDAQTSTDKNTAGTEKVYDKHSATTTTSHPENFQSYVHIQRPTNFPCSIPDNYGDSNQDNEKHNVSYCEYTSYYSEKCDKYKTSCEYHKSDDNHKHPASPSTVCCSILSNTSNDCCGIIVNAAKKELNGKSLTKVESTDSNSSDSGGFKDFVQLDLSKTANQVISHQRKISQPEFLEKNDYVKPYTHQRNSSQPDYISSEVRQSIVTNKQTFVANAQALAQYLPQAEHKFLCKTSNVSSENTEDIRHVVAKLNVTQVNQMFNEKTDENKPQNKPRQQIITQSQFQQSTKKLEELLSQRLEKERMLRKGQNCLPDGETSQDVDHKIVIQKQIQQKLHADLQQTVKQIQEIQSIELRLPQNRKWNELTMDDPEIQETVESILGKGAKVVDCEKKSSIKEEEVLFINGMPVTLEGRDGMAIKQALMTGQMPSCDLLNTLLIKTGILKAPVKMDTSLSVKSTTVTKEEVTVSRDGKIIDERCRETKEHNYYTTETSEVYEAVRVLPSSQLLGGHYSNGRSPENGKSCDHNGYETGSENKFGSCSSASSYESDCPSGYKPNNCLSKDSGHLTNSMSTTKVDFTPSSIDSLSSLDETDYKTDLANKFRRCGVNGNGYRKEFSPTIFGTVASDHTPKDCSNRRSVLQTPQTKSFCLYNNGEAVPENLSDPAVQHDKALVYRDGNLISGSLDALIQHLVPTDTYYPDRAYIFAFLLSSRLYIKPHDLLDTIRSLSEHQQGLGLSAKNIQPGNVKFAEHLVQLLAEWTETFPYDFRDERVMQHVRTITQHCCTLNSSLRANVSSLLHNLLQRLTALESYERSLEIPPASLDENGIDITELCPHTGDLAQQLTHVELERLSYIGPEEFVQAFAKENPHLETSFKDMKKTHNLEQYVQWFNRLSYFVATQVCRYPKKKQRVKVVEYWIEVGRECFNIGNFNSLMAIIAGLNMSPISRLKKTWNKIHSGKFAILEHQMDPSSNFSSYRSTLKAAMWRSAGATDQRQRIVIPFFSLLVKDLYFLNQGCSNKLPNGHINFEKFWQLAKQVTEFMAWKQVKCPFEKDQKIITILQHGPILNENALALASFECEPPDNNQEKERCKSLKAEGNNT